ncbi:MAG: TIGR04086 family membrane protein [Candidatus Syntrophonatronum acetioxidans]|uniref:TIGR04086 family membrane protein n=1 Tax=Candidatus Syntrophonatronum acetioxidans TaxID=1795816 RepID=A0A424YH74_9FIRM|nr:MAG: TIGR04086 family membrane protein [Candidatus Syntrophonatronum acetioxidans]
MKNIPAFKVQPDFKTLPLIGAGVLLALVFSLLVFALASLILSYTAVPERILPYLSFFTSFFSIFAGALYVSRRIGYQGWLNGGLTGFFYVLIVLVLGLFLAGELPLFSSFIIKVFLGFIFGAVSGIIGMNL